jgi:tetratricopeptide (TPR) repeat protein
MSKKQRPKTAAPAAVPDPAHSTEETIHKALELYRKHIEPNAKPIFAGIAVVCAVVIVVNVVAARRQAKTAAAFAALAEAEEVSTYYDLARTYKGMPAGTLAGLKAAHKLFEEGSFKEAAGRYELAASTADPAIAARARLGQAYCVEAQGDIAKASSLFEQVAGSASSWDVKADACLGAGRAARLQGDVAAAGEWYRKAEQAAAADDTGIAKSRVRDALATLKMYELAAPAPAPVPVDETEEGEGEETPTEAGNDDAE